MASNIRKALPAVVARGAEAFPQLSRGAGARARGGGDAGPGMRVIDDKLSDGVRRVPYYQLLCSDRCAEEEDEEEQEEKEEKEEKEEVNEEERRTTTTTKRMRFKAELHARSQQTPCLG